MNSKKQAKEYRLPFDTGESLPNITEALHSIDHFGKWARIVLAVLVGICITSGYLLIGRLSSQALIQVPVSGGHFSEGVTGTVRFINPLLATSEAEKTLSSLVYSGLMRVGENGRLMYDLAEEYAVTNDGLIYTFLLREDLTWHDGKPLTAEDVAFTISLARDNIIKSREGINWEGIEVTVLNDRTIEFVLAEPYARLLTNTTLGIMPKHIWKDVPPEEFSFDVRNLEDAIGSGPFEILRVEKDRSGVPNFFALRSFNNFALGRPHIDSVTVRVYPNLEKVIEAYDRGDVMSIGSLTSYAATIFANSDKEVVTEPLPRVFALFLNQNQAEVLKDKQVREALALAIDKNRLVADVLGGYGSATDSPLGVVHSSLSSQSDASSLDVAKEILESAGWLIPEVEVFDDANASSTDAFPAPPLPTVRENDGERLTLSIATSDVPDMKETAEIVRQYWEALGVDVTIQVFERGDLKQNVIQPRKFDVLLFGNFLDRFPDPYAFFHSSQRLDPGLNVAGYIDPDTDEILEDIRTSSDPRLREEKLQDFEKTIINTLPVIFLYVPDYLYLPPEDVLSVRFGTLGDAADRFDLIHTWYMETDTVWRMFAPTQIKENIINY